MPRQHLNRTIGTERSLARRIEAERRRRNLGVEALAKLMTEAGCEINGSAIYRIEKGDPPRRISVDELIALSKVFELDVEDLLTPIELVRQQRAREIAKAMPAAFGAYDAAILEGLQLYVEYKRLAKDAPELLEFMNSHFAATVNRVDERFDPARRVDLGALVSDRDIKDFRWEVVQLWGRMMQLADKAVGGEG